MNISATLLKLFGWRVHITAPDYPKAIICVAPHTSNMDFIIGKLAYASVGRKAGFLMKKFWFFFPIGYLMRAIGGIPVDRSGGSPSLVADIVERFNRTDNLVLAITPEGTRKRVEKWHTGFLRIAYAAGIPVAIGIIDYATRSVIIRDTYNPTGNIDKDMSCIKEYYRAYQGKYPERFAI